MATSVVFPRVQFFADNGRPLIGGRIHTYIAGTSSRAPTYKDAARAQPNTNPIILDGRGEASVYLTEGVEYKFVVEDSKGALIMTQEPVYGAIWPDPESWPSDATLAYQYMLDARAAASAIGPLKFYDTYAQAVSDLPNLSEDDLVEIAQDETRASSPRARYKVASGALVFVIEFDIFYPGIAGSVPRPVQLKLRDTVSVKDFGAVGDGVSDDTAAIQLACAASDYVFFPHGEYLIGVNTTIPFGVVLKFAFGARIKVGTDVTLTFNGGIEANPYQHIFSGHLIQSDFIPGAVPPYVFGVQGSPQIDYATPFWFGAKGDDVSDDGPSIDCSLHFGFTTYIPSANYYTSRGFNVKRSNVRIYGDGRSSRVRTDNPLSPAVMQFNGNVVPVANCVCEDIAFDAGGLPGVNGFGFGFSSNCVLRNAWFYNCGHYAFTMQFDVFDNLVEDIFIDESAIVAGSTRASFSFEGAQTDGSDCRGNTVRNIYTKKAHNKLVKMTRSSMCCVSGVWSEVVGLGGAEPAAIHMSACWDCIVENVFVDTITGLGINIVGQANCRRNTLRGIKFGMISGNISILIDGRENILDGVTIKTDYSAAPAVRVRDENNYLKNIFITDAPSARVIICDIAGTGSVFDGCRVTGSAGVGFYTSQPNVKVINNYFRTDGFAIDIEGAGCLVKGNTIEGNAANRINIRSAGAGCVVVDNYLTGGSAATVSGTFAGYASSVVCNNSGDNGTVGTVRIGSYSLWVDSVGRLRLKLGNRGSDTDGVIVGTQS